MPSKVDYWLKRLLPRRCVLCGMEAGYRNLCTPCLADMPWIDPRCDRCGAALTGAAERAVCACDDLRLECIDRVFAALVYEYPVDRLIVDAKFHARPDLARASGDALLWALGSASSLSQMWPDLLVPVPLHPNRFHSRGFNQSIEIARPVARRLGIKLARNACIRQRDTPAQSTLSGRLRRTNPRNAFVARAVVSGRHVAIVDDVITTGSTASAVAVALRAAGAEAVSVWCVARVMRSQAAAAKL
ncbi:MAG: ComF family protein [Gammaproteobacteria bacterium]|nr:ComF family protein [Gammaproteobacteria bacterium]